MTYRKTLLALAAPLAFLNAPAAHCFAEAAPASPHSDAERHTEPDRDHDESDKEEGEHIEKAEHREERKIEQVVPIAFVPAAVLDAVKKELPSGNVTEAKLKAARGRIMYCFDVTAGDTKYEVEITVDGKFFSKKVDDDNADFERQSERKD